MGVELHPKDEDHRAKSLRAVSICAECAQTFRHGAQEQPHGRGREAYAAHPEVAQLLDRRHYPLPHREGPSVGIGEIRRR